MAQRKFYPVAGKRVFDLVICACSSVVLIPATAVIAVLIKLDSKGPVFYTQERIGVKGEPFNMYKFRSMLTLEESYDSAGKPLENYARVTRIGKLLRATSVDELPQLINIFKGDMSLIGPRPTLKYQVEKYDERQRTRLAVRPGLTGWAQVNGRNSLTWDEKIEFDIEYVEKMSFQLDLEIVKRTFGVLLKQESVAFEKHDHLSEHADDFRKDI